MSKKPNRDRALQAMARCRASVPREIGTRRGSTLGLYLNGPVLFPGDEGVGFGAEAVVACLKANRSAGQVIVHIDSAGGSGAAARTIYSALREHRGYKIITTGDLCASAATLILMAGDFRTCDPNTQFLIHDPEISAQRGERWTAAKHARAANVLRRGSAELVAIYAERTGRDARIFEREIKNEDCMRPSRARQLGLVHCMSGEECWVNGRPYFFPVQQSSITANIVAAFSPAELQTIVRKNSVTWRNSPLEHLARATTHRGGEKPCR